MSEVWQVYKKIGSRWITVGEPTNQVAAEAAVSAMQQILDEHARECADRKKRNIKRMPPDPGFREPHCVPL